MDSRVFNLYGKSYASMPVAEMAVRLRRTSGAVGLMADKLGCRKKKNTPWSDAEMEIIRDYYARGAEACTFALLLLGRSIRAIFSMAATLGEKWPILAGGRAAYPEGGLRQDGRCRTRLLPGRNKVPFRVMVKKLGLKKSRHSETGFRHWSEEEWGD